MPVPLGIVIIGRNEGERLERCLRSVAGQSEVVVYVDSGSTDASIEQARASGAEVVSLDTSRPFSAARARNAGWVRLLEVMPHGELVQFVDGDCEVADGWLAAAREFLFGEPLCTVACGRRREVAPEVSIYNRLCDLEWDTPVGEARSCGGDAMMRLDVVVALRGFNPGVVAGEEPELCFRIRREGGSIQRLDQEMTRHDAGMTRFTQWWRRAVRAGHAYAQGMAMHGRAPERFCVRPSVSIWVWALALPVLSGVLAWPTHGWSLLALWLYPLQVLRVAIGQRKRGRSLKDAWLFAAFCVLAKWPQLQGQTVFLWRRLFGHEGRIIEYKGDAPK